MALVNLKDNPSADQNSRARDLEWIDQIMEYTMKIMSFNIFPVYVFDGEEKDAKKGTHEKRSKQKQDTKNKIDELVKKLDSIDVLDIDDDEVEQLRKLKTSVLKVDRDTVQKFKDLLSAIGLPVITAKGEAEKLCCIMANKGLVSGVHSEDTDCIALRCPLLITGITKGSYGNKTQVNVTKFHPILKTLNITYESFLDLCIMSGCDYNERISGIGPEKAFKLISDLESIDNLPETIDKTCLNYEMCRELFSLDNEEDFDVEMNVDIDFDKIFDKETLNYMKSFNMEDKYYALVSLYKTLKTVKRIKYVDPSKPKKKIKLICKNTGSSKLKKIEDVRPPLNFD